MKTLKRSKLKYKLRKVRDFPITIASAPSGYGKTTALHSYLEGQKATYIWFSMYAQKDELWAWSKIIQRLKQEYQGIQLTNSIPNSSSTVEDFIETLHQHITKPLFIILDDVTIDDIPNIIKTLAIYSYMGIPSIHFIVLMKDTLDKIAPYQFSNNIIHLNTNDFAFTKEETMHLCRLEQMKLSDDEIETVYTCTNGWILAITLMLDSYKTYGELHYQVDINNLIQCVYFEKLNVQIQTDLIKLSLLKSFTFDFAYKICDTKQTLEELVQLEKENHLIQPITSNSFQFIPIFKEFLAKKLYTAPIDVEVYTKTFSQYYLEQDEPLDAIDILLSIRDFDSIISIFNQYIETGFADIAPNLITRVFQKLPDHYKNEYPFIYLKWIIDCITNFPQFDGISLLEDFKNRIDNNLIQVNKDQLYGEYYFIHAFIYFNDIERMMDDFKTSYQYFKGGHSQFAYPFMITSFGSCHMLFLYYNKAGRLQETVEFIKQNTHYFMSITNGIHSGSINLVKAEYFFAIGEYKKVELHAELAFKEAMKNNQLSGAICCLFVLGRLSLIEHDITKFKRIEERLIDFYTLTNIPILHNEIDCALGYLYILSDNYNKVKPWLRNGDFDSVYLLPEAIMMAYIVHGICLINEPSSIQLKYNYEMIRQTNNEVHFVYADIFANLFETIYYYKIGKTQEALGSLNKTISLCRKDGLISPIIELSFSFYPLFEDYSPDDFYAEKVSSAVLKHFEVGINSPIAVSTLTPKEKEVLKLCSYGKKVKEIAEMKHISVNTVQSHMKSIYKKLEISSKLEAIQYYNNNFE